MEFDFGGQHALWEEEDGEENEEDFERLVATANRERSSFWLKLSIPVVASWC